MSGIKSLLKIGIESMPDNIKRESVVPTLLKKGVKQEELEFSGIDKFIPNKSRVTREELLDAEAMRDDSFNKTTRVQGDNTDYNSVTLNYKGLNNPTYRENIYTFSDLSSQEKGFVSNHFPEVKDYLFHTRTYTEPLGDVDTHIVTEIQSDLHQKRRQAINNISFENVERNFNNTFSSTSKPDEENMEILRGYLKDAGVEDTEQMDDAILTPLFKKLSAGEDVKETILELWEGLPKSPLEKTWTTKAIENEVISALDRGLTQVAIPIKQSTTAKSPVEAIQLLRTMDIVAEYERNTEMVERLARQAGWEGNEDADIWVITRSGIETGNIDKIKSLARSEGAQSFYENQVANTAKKVAKRSNLDFQIESHNGIDYAVIKAKPENVTQVTGDYTDKELDFIKQFEELKSLNDASYKEYSKYSSKVLESYTEMFPGKYPENIAQVETFYNKLIEKGPRSKTKVINKPQYNLYAPAQVTALSAYMAMQEYGFSEEEIRSNLSKKIDEDEVNEVMDYINNNITKAIEAGYTVEDIRQKIDSMPTELKDKETGFAGPTDKSGKIPNATKPKAQAYNDIVDEKDIDNIEELLAKMEIIKPTMTSYMTAISSYYGDEEAKQRYASARANSRAQIVKLAKEQFDLELQWRTDDYSNPMSGDFFVNTENGLQPVTPDLLQTLISTSGETIGAIGGALAGAKAGFAAAPPVLPIVGPFSKVLGAGIGALTGGAIGAMAGSQFDYLVTAIQLQQDMEAEVAAQKALDAAEISAIGDIVGYGVFKTLGIGWKGILRAKNMVADGNTKGAYNALKDITGLSEEQIDDVVKTFEKFTPLEGKSKEQKAIIAMSNTNSAIREGVRVASGFNTKMGSNLARQVDKRAKDMLSSTAELTDPQAAKTFAQDLDNYVSDVKDYYGLVKAQAAEAPNGLAYEWDYDKLALEPVLDMLSGKLGLKGVSTVVTDPSAQKFLTQASRIRDLSESTNFADLIELRQLVNEFLYNKRISKADTKGMLREVLGRIDSEIKFGADTVFDNPKGWLDNWADARMKYSKMKEVQKTSMYRMMFDKDGKMKPVQPESVIKALYKNITALDGSFEQVMRELPIEGRKKYEGAVVDYLANKFTVGKDTKAIDFIGLQEELNKVGFSTTEAQVMKRTINEFAEVFKNDPALAQISGQIEIPRFQSYLTADPVVRAKFEIASGVFNTIKRWVPGKQQNTLALVKNMSDLLDNPLNAKASKEIMEQFPNNKEVIDSLVKMQQAAARRIAEGKDISAPRVKLYCSGNTLSFKGPGKETTLPRHRIISLEQARTVAESQGITVDSPMFNVTLKNSGYLAIMQGTDRVNML